MCLSQPQLLNAIYQKIYDTTFNFYSFDSKLELQKAVYLLREKGITCGDYYFAWDKHGPYSAELSDDMKNEYVDKSVDFTDEALREMDNLKKVLNNDYDNKNRSYWVEAVASLHYLKKHIHPTFNKDELISNLMENKKHLNSISENQRAYEEMVNL